MKKIDNVIKFYSLSLSLVLTIATVFNYFWLIILSSSENGREILASIFSTSYYYIILANICAIFIVIFCSYLFFKLNSLNEKIYTKKFFIITCFSFILVFFILFLPLWILLIIRQLKNVSDKTSSNVNLTN